MIYIHIHFHCLMISLNFLSFIGLSYKTFDFARKFFSFLYHRFFKNPMYRETSKQFEKSKYPIVQHAFVAQANDKSFLLEFHNGILTSCLRREKSSSENSSLYSMLPYFVNFSSRSNFSRSTWTAR